MEIIPISERSPEEYESVIRNATNGMFFHSLKYRDHLLSVIDVDVRYLIAYDDGKPVGALPLCIYRNDEYGNVLNSLPFFGSHGGAVTVSSLSETDKEAVRRELLSMVPTVAQNQDCVFSTVINTPYETDDVYRDILGPDYIDTRIGQIKTLPDSPDSETLLYDVEKRCRTAIRKAMKEGIEVVEETEQNDIRERLIREHHTHMDSIGGTAKPPEFFCHLEEFYEPLDDFRIYVARYKGDIAGILLLFYYDDIVEYYTPVTVPEYRDLYPMNYLIYVGMQDAIRADYSQWNFGGTWTTQDGVYKFKRSFEPDDLEYYYFVNRYEGSEDLLSLTPEEMQSAYPWFYVIPFNELR